mgnify:CR=1 FL=1
MIPPILTDPGIDAFVELIGGEGDPAKSAVMNRITGTGPGARMPLNGEPLSEREVGIIRKWIEQGAK